MTLDRHYFIQDSDVSGDGIVYKNKNKSSNEVMVLSVIKGSSISTATTATITFKGKLVNSDDFIALKGIKTTDYSFVDSCDLNEVVYLDIIGYKEIQISSSNADGKISVIGEVID